MISAILACRWTMRYVTIAAAGAAAICETAAFSSSPLTRVPSRVSILRYSTISTENEAPRKPSSSASAATDTRRAVKQALLEALGATSAADTVLACPISLRPLSTRTKLAGPFWEIKYKVCDEFGTTYPFNGLYTDLVPEDDKKSRKFWQLSPRERVSTELFRSPLTSFLYERGWRQNFKASGFPGIDKEFEELSGFLQDVEGGTIVDLSCGSGLMTRRLVKSRRWRRVIAADFSETMLLETRLRFKRARLNPPELIRCDAARLPFQENSLDAIHAGAALHCWPRLEESLREVYRVLRPGGKFFATTFAMSAPIRSAASGRGGGDGDRGMKFFEQDELKNLLTLAGFGLDNVEVRKIEPGCLIAKATK